MTIDPIEAVRCKSKHLCRYFFYRWYRGGTCVVWLKNPTARLGAIFREQGFYRDQQGNLYQNKSIAFRALALNYFESIGAIK